MSYRYIIYPSVEGFIRVLGFGGGHERVFLLVSAALVACHATAALTASFRLGRATEKDRRFVMYCRVCYVCLPLAFAA